MTKAGNTRSLPDKTGKGCAMCGSLVALEASLEASLGMAALLFALISLAFSSVCIGSTLPSICGVNIHWTNPAPGELAMLSAGGFTWISFRPCHCAYFSIS